jgi:mono/diheme cytochrome c family protein
LLSTCGGETPPRFSEAQTLGGQEISAEILNAGARTYQLYCASCHGGDGSGNGPAAASLDPKPRDFRTGGFAHKSTPGDELPTHEDLKEVITKGVPARGMPAWAGLRSEDLDAVAHYLKTFSTRWRNGQ